MPVVSSSPIVQSALDWVLTSPVFTASVVTFAYFLYHVIKVMVVDPLTSPLQKLPGPPKPGKFFDFTHMIDAMDTMRSFRKQQEWREMYGKSMRIQGFGYWDQRLLTFDTRAMNYILCQATEMYPKPWQSRRMLTRLLGEGVAVTEGEQHKIQRRIINPAFAPSALRRLYPIFFNKAEELRDRWMGIIGGNHEIEMDINHWIGRATFDAFALAGFDYRLDVIKNEDHELYLAYKHMFDAAVNKGQTLIGFFEVYLPWINKVIPNEAHRQIVKSRVIIERAGEEVLKSKRDAILRSKSTDVDSEKFPVQRDQRDILSLLIKSNLAEASASQRISDAELLAQIHSFLFVGSDSVSLTILWTLYYLSRDPALQTRLREEILAHGPLDPVNPPDATTLPFLDLVVKESMRLAPPVQSTLRAAARDDVIPTEDGQGIQIRKGEFVHLPIEGTNLAKEIWGEDAWEFKPDRWTNLPEAARRTPGLVSNLMTFSIGSHSCPAAQFAIMEAKTFLSRLIASFEFTPVPNRRVVKTNCIVTRPFVSGEWSKGTQLPMLVKPYVPPSAL